MAWRHAKQRNYISKDDSAPYRTLLHVVREHDLLPEDMVPSADDYGDDNKLPGSVYDRAVETVESEYGVSSGRQQTGSGGYVPTEDELGLDEEPEDEEEELEQFVS